MELSKQTSTSCPEQVGWAASPALPLPALPAALLQQDVLISKAKGQQEIPTSTPLEHGGSRSSSVTQSRGSCTRHTLSSTRHPLTLLESVTGGGNTLKLLKKKKKNSPDLVNAIL